jgi:DNA adenine methylase
MESLSPLRYPGGKNKTYQYVRHLVKINNISTYIEPFAGGAAVALRLLVNNDVNKIIINDYDRGIYALWHVIVTRPQELIELIHNTPIDMNQWYIQREVQERKKTADELELAFSTLFLNRTNRSGIIKGGVNGGKNQDSPYKIDCRFTKKTIIDRIKLISNYSDRIKVCNYDAIEFIETEIKQTRKSLTFFDPPYYKKGHKLYTDFYKHKDHVKLAKVIKSSMRNRYWILTYDIANEIKELYKNYESIRYYLNYSISTPTKGQEFMFFSNKTEMGAVEEYLIVV